ncbi:MAG: DUF3857 domain-containing protein [Acidobacteriaceae bacterium]
MTSDPAAPGAPAVYLLREQIADDEGQMRIFHARIKILTEAGRQQFSDVTVPYEDREENIKDVEAWTIHSDGTVIPFAGKPWQKLVVRSGDVRYMEKGFSLPDVQVGSILEYRYEITYYGLWAPQWYLQQPVPVLRAHYYFNPGAGDVRATRYLPAGAVIDDKRGFDLTLDNVPALAEEDDSPPMHSLGYRVLFYYGSSLEDTPEKYWSWQGEVWSKGVNDYAAPGKLKKVVAQIVSPGDTDEQKLKKIYAAVMKVDNMDFTRENTQEENKAEKLKFGNAADIWRQQRGYDREITMLFLGLVRAAGFKAYAMFVTSRDNNIFLKQQLDWDQLDDEVVIVDTGGKEMYFDPGERYCEFGQLHWKHTATTGIRQTEKGTDFANTPFPRYTDTTEHRVADLTLDADGTVHGTVTVTMTGAIALRWRQEALLSDAEEVRRQFSDELQQGLAPGMTVKITELDGLTDDEQPLRVVLSVTGPLGVARHKRIFVPGTFFEVQAKARFVNATRDNPVYLHYPYSIEDEVRMKLPANSTAEALPTDAHQSMPDADFIERYRSGNGIYEYGRLERVASILYPTTEYPALRDFFQKMNAQDHAPLVLELAPSTAQAEPGKQ